MNYTHVITVAIVAAVGRQKIEFFLLYRLPSLRTDNAPPHNTSLCNDDGIFRRV